MVEEAALIDYKDMAFWFSPEFSENNLCELVGARN